MPSQNLGFGSYKGSRTIKLNLCIAVTVRNRMLSTKIIDFDTKMSRWASTIKIPLNSNCSSSPVSQIFASLLFCPSSKTLIAPSKNVIFFTGDRVRGTNNPLIQRLSDPGNIARLLVEKFGSSTNVWVLEASRFNGAFAVYEEFVPSLDCIGDPIEGYGGHGLLAASNLVSVFCKAIDQIQSKVSSCSTKSFASIEKSCGPETVLLGFSKGGVVINEIIAELAYSRPLPPLYDQMSDHIFPATRDDFLSSISEIHYVDVGLNIKGAYLTDRQIISNAVKRMLISRKTVRFVLHGSPRQWGDPNRPWICREKDLLLQTLREEADRYEGQLQVIERTYFRNSPPSLQMHFEIIDNMDVS